MLKYVLVYLKNYVNILQGLFCEYCLELLLYLMRISCLIYWTLTILITDEGTRDWDKSSNRVKA